MRVFLVLIFLIEFFLAQEINYHIKKEPNNIINCEHDENILDIHDVKVYRNKVYVLDKKECKIFILDNDKLVKTFGKMGKGPGEFDNVRKLSINNEGILTLVDNAVCDKILEYDEKGKLINERKKILYINKIKKIKKGYIVEEIERKYTKEAKLYKYNLYLTDERLKNYELIDSTDYIKRSTYIKGLKVPIPTPYYPIYNWELIEDKILIFKANSNIVKIFDINKEAYKTIELNIPEKIVTARDKEYYYNNTLFWQSSGQFEMKAPSYILKHTVFPQKLPYFDCVLKDNNNNILVREPSRKENSSFFVYDKNMNFMKKIQLNKEIFNNKAIITEKFVYSWISGITDFAQLLKYDRKN